MVNVPNIAATAIGIVGHQSIDVERRTGGLNAEGAWVDGAPSTTTHSGVTVQPASGRDLLRLDEGRRGSETIRIFGRAQLFSARDPGSAARADIVIYDGNRYEVESVQAWAGEFFDALAVRVGD